MTDNVLDLDLCGQRKRLSAGLVEVPELIQACLARIESANPTLNAFTSLHVDRALQEAEVSAQRYRDSEPRLLEGLPIAIKDNLAEKGLANRAGMALEPAPQAEVDAGAVALLREAGAIIIGRLNMNEGALGADGNNPHLGRCNNPLNLDQTPGGSSSGSASAVAARLVSASLGTDTMGSVRIPAAYCGIWGLKPSTGLISTAGSVAVSRRLDCIGPLTRSARDLSLMLEVLVGYDPNCPVSLPVDPDRSADAHTLHLGCPDARHLDLDPVVENSWLNALGRLSALFGDPVRLTASDLDFGRIRRAGLLVCESEMLTEHAAMLAAGNLTLSPELAQLLDWARSRSAPDLAAALRRLDDGRTLIQRWLSQCDVVILPTTPQRAFAHGQPTPVNQADLTCLANCAGLPALSLPLTASDGDLPVGLQLIGRWGSDFALVRLAGYIAGELAAA